MTDISRITKATTPLTHAGVPGGFLPWLLTDLARAAPRRAVFIATDESEMRSVADTATWFAPEVRVLTFPAWDCLPWCKSKSGCSLHAVEERGSVRIRGPKGWSERLALQPFGSPPQLAGSCLLLTKP